VTSPTDFLAEPDVVLLDVQARSGEDAVRVLHERLTAENPAVTDPARFLDDVFERMRIASVCVSDDIALPHARTNAVTQLTMAVGRARDGVSFDADHPQVHLIVLMGTPKDAVGDYLRTVAALSRVLRHPPTRAGLMAAQNEEEFRALLAGAMTTKR
jgi:mannitol/fructose-specific phosphotransferase system IIA component (Ntr-type)